MPSFSYAGLSKRLAYLQAALKYLAIATLAWSLPVQLSMACSCIEQDDVTPSLQFLSKEYLPVNAKGVLYLRKVSRADIGYDDFIGYRDETERRVFTHILKRSPTLFSMPVITVRDESSKELLKHRVKRLDLALNKKPDVERYFLFKDPSLEQCMAIVSDEKTSKHCEPYQLFANNQISIEQMLSQKILQEVSAEINAAYGLFRIEPEAKFIRDHRYEFTAKFNSHSGSVSETIFTTTIHPAFNRSELAKIKLNIEGIPKEIKVWDDCSARSPGLIQALRYELPESLKPYQNHLLYLTQRRTVPETSLLALSSANQAANSTSAFYFIPDYKPPCSAKLEFGDEGHGKAQQEIYTAPLNYGESRSIEVRGYVGLLELDEKLTLTPITSVKFEKTWYHYLLDKYREYREKKQQDHKSQKQPAQ